MMVRYGQISKIATGVCLAAGMLLLAACNNGQSDGEPTTVTIQKDGTVLSHIEESFEQDYYDMEELQQTILMEAADYNKMAGEGKISVEKISVDGGVATVRMVYQEPADYAAFNKVSFFAGAAGNVPEGYDLNVVLSSVKNANETIGKSDILGMEGYKLLVMDIQEPVYLDGRAEYVSSNVTVADDRKSVWLSGEGLGYALYK